MIVACHSTSCKRSGDDCGAHRELMCRLKNLSRFFLVSLLDRRSLMNRVTTENVVSGATLPEGLMRVMKRMNRGGGCAGGMQMFICASMCCVSCVHVLARF